MESGFMVYKCRRCGKINRSLHVPNGITAIIAAKHNTPLPKEWGPMKIKLVDICNCDGDNIGISDLIGFEKDKNNS